MNKIIPIGIGLGAVAVIIGAFMFVPAMQQTKLLTSTPLQTEQPKYGVVPTSADGSCPDGYKKIHKTYDSISPEDSVTSYQRSAEICTFGEYDYLDARDNMGLDPSLAYLEEKPKEQPQPKDKCPEGTYLHRYSASPGEAAVFEECIPDGERPPLR